MMAFMLVIAAALRNWLGKTGVAIGAGVAGFVDTHAAATTVASLVGATKTPPQEAVLPISAAMTISAVAKIGAGSPDFAQRVTLGRDRADRGGLGGCRANGVPMTDQARRGSMERFRC
jgi:uncharacterized membrane protein (DUF4010 family)